jgi:hypothetical protein
LCLPLLLAEDGAKGTANFFAALLPDLFATVNAARQVKMYSQAETPNKEYLLDVSIGPVFLRLAMSAFDP